MNFDFDAFEFVGLLAPGTVVVLAIAMLYPQLLHLADPGIIIAFGVVAAYIAGHLVGAIGNVLEDRLPKMWPRGLASLSRADWIDRCYLGDDQKREINRLLSEKLRRSGGLGRPDSGYRKTVVKQMFLAVLAGGHKRAETFNGLFNLSRGLAVSFLITTIASAVAGQYLASGLSIAAFVLAMYRTWKFKDKYSEELVQQFLLP